MSYHHTEGNRSCSHCGVSITRGSRSGKCFTCYHGTRAFRAPPPARVWCGQCERNVYAAEGAACASTWCKAKGVAA